MENTEENKKTENDNENFKKAFEEEKNKVEDYIKMLKYLKADFENYKRRVEREFEEKTHNANQRLIIELLPIIDELEFAIILGKKNGNHKSLIEGIEMIQKKLYKVLENEGFSEIITKDITFDPNKHDCIEKVFLKECKDGIILEEIRKGYTFKGKVIRPSLVKVGMVKKEENSGG